MKRIILAALAASMTTAAFAADPPKPAGLDAARKAFVAVVKAKDWKGLGEMVSWPMPVEAYETPPKVEKAAYLKDHTKFTMFLGDDAVLKCIGGDKAEYQGDKSQFGFGSWVIDCNGNEYFFGVKGGKVLFTGYQNINE